MFACIKTAVPASNCVVRRDRLLSQLFGYGSGTTAGINGTETLITDVTDGSFEAALTDATPRLICFPDGYTGTWTVPAGTFTPAANKYVDGSGADVTWQLGLRNAYTSINGPKAPGAYGCQLAWDKGQFGMSDITWIGDMAWPFAYESPYFANGDTDAEIWGGSNYFFNNLTIKGMSDESLSVYHLNGGSPDLVTFSNINFLETKTGSLIGASGGVFPRGKITVAYNLYNEMVNGRSPGEVRNMDAHVYNNVIRYMNDEGYKVGESGRVVSEGNLFDMGCNSGVSGPRTIRHVYESPQGILWSDGDIIDPVAASCPSTGDSGFIGQPTAKPFTPPYAYSVLSSRQDIENYVVSNAGKRTETINYCAKP